MSIKDFKRYKCDECDKNFTLNIELKAYIAAAHDKIFNCDQCGKNLATRCNSLQKKFHKSHLQIGIGITHKSQYRLRSIIACKKICPKGFGQKLPIMVNGTELKSFI